MFWGGRVKVQNSVHSSRKFVAVLERAVRAQYSCNLTNLEQFFEKV